VEVKAVVFVGVFNRSIDATNISVARVSSASIVVIAGNRGRDTTRFKIARIGITFIIIVATVRVIINYTSFLFITVSFVAFIRRNTLSRNINVYASSLSTAAIFSASIFIIAYNFFIFTRRIFSTIRVTCISGASIVIVAVDS
jgi:hypothetical protein